MKSVFNVIEPGIAGILVDNGRYGYQHLGFTPSGPLDDVAFFWANALTGNVDAKSYSALELMGNTEFEALTELQCCIAGPDCKVKVNNKDVESWSTLTLNVGDRLSVSTAKIGKRYYLAVSGGFDAPNVLGSKSTVLREHLGGLNGEGGIVNQGDVLCATDTVCNLIALRQKTVPDYSLDQPIQVILGYQFRELGGVCCGQFFSQSYSVSPDSNRMGYRLNGEPLPSLSRKFYSEGVHTGAIQIPPNGLPIILLTDRQTLGGYPKIGAIARIDLHRFVHALPGDNIEFTPIDVYSARNQWRLRQRNWHKTIENFK